MDEEEEENTQTKKRSCYERLKCDSQFAAPDSKQEMRNARIYHIHVNIFSKKEPFLTPIRNYGFLSFLIAFETLMKHSQ